MRVAPLQACLTVLWLAVPVGWLVLYRDQPLPAGAGAACLVLSPALVLGLEFLAQRHVSRGDATPRASGLQMLKAWLAEVVVATRVFCWRQPFRSRRFADQLGPEHHGRRGVVLVHGYLCNRGLWNPWMARLQQEGLPFVAVDLEPVFGSIDLHAPSIDRAIARMASVTGRPPLVVGHSMGGLALMAWLRWARAPDRVHRFVSLGTPHGGTWLARWGHASNARQMRWGSAWLQDLRRDIPPAWHARWVCFYSNADNIVFPPSLARLEGARNRLVAGRAHVQLAHDPEVMAAVLELLRSAEPEPVAQDRALPAGRPSV